jgi:glucokinase
MDGPIQIVADIGGTNARFAYVKADSDHLLGVEIFPCADFAFLADAVNTYIKRGHVERVDTLCLAVAGPVENDWMALSEN